MFKNIGAYDFREEGEISVDVLGHLFERSITELEKLRSVGMFGKQAEQSIGRMPKSAERKRFGIYYTPPRFTRLIVEETLGRLIVERVESVPDVRAGRGAADAEGRGPRVRLSAFLIAAYERFQDAYEDIARLLRIEGHLQEALNLSNAYPDFILSDNLYGVDLSAESVEITQLALWIRSARKGRALNDLSRNVVQGNSLIRDPAVHAKAFVWEERFPAVFASGGFDVVVGNPPWERMKIQEREFFAIAAPEIASSVSAADRRTLIAAIESAIPSLWEHYAAAQLGADRTLAYVRSAAANFPLTGRGDINTYMLFAELSRQLVSPTGHVGLLVPSGIATDSTTRAFFSDLMETRTLSALYDFENKKLVFADVDGRFKFSILLMTGKDSPQTAAEFVFFAHSIDDLTAPHRKIKLSPKDLKLLNPNSRTCPIFRTRRDAELTKRILSELANSH